MAQSGHPGRAQQQLRRPVCILARRCLPSLVLMSDSPYSAFFSKLKAANRGPFVLRLNPLCFFWVRSSMKVLGVRDLYFEPVAVSHYVAWGRGSAPARPRLSMANIGNGQFPSDHCQGNGDYSQCHFRPEID
jgi:hypothetical protein